MEDIADILSTGNTEQKLSLFQFDKDHTEDAVLVKFNLWARYFFPNYFTSGDAGFHHDIDKLNLRAYRGLLTTYVNIAFRGAAKTARTKLFMAYVILNDTNHFRKYIKVLSADGDNSTQIVTDVYNMLVNPSVHFMYPEVFKKTSAKREERMSSFTTHYAVKMIADTVGTDQRGALQEDARPDLIWYEDFENRATLRSARKTLTIWDNMEEARTGLAVGGSSIYTCNYISEQGNVHKLVTKASGSKMVLIVPIIAQDGTSAWSERYSLPDIEQMKMDDDDFEGERMCRPSASKDIMFDRETLEKMESRTPIKDSAGFKIYKQFDPSHRYGSGHDVAGGVGLDSSTSVFIDFDTIPAQVVGVFNSNTIKPNTFGDEIARESDIFGGSIAGIERNSMGSDTVSRAKQLDVNLYRTQAAEAKIDGSYPTMYGWHTNSATKPKMLFALGKAIESGWIALNDPDLIRECMAYTRNDLIEEEKDPRLTTRHFDLVIACAIAWQMRDFSEINGTEIEEIEESEPLYADIGI